VESQAGPGIAKPVQRGCDDPGAYQRRQADPQKPRRFRCQQGQFRLDPLDPLPRRSASLAIGIGLCRKREPPRGAVKEAYAQPFLKATDSLGDSGCRQAEPGGSRRETSSVTNLKEHAHFVTVRMAATRHSGIGFVNM
jgi:hypothetical protein